MLSNNISLLLLYPSLIFLFVSFSLFLCTLAGHAPAYTSILYGSVHLANVIFAILSIVYVIYVWSN